MGYVVYHKESTLYLRSWLRTQGLPTKGVSLNPVYVTAGAAKATLTRAVKALGLKREDFDWSDAAFFHNEIEQKEVRYGIAMSEGKSFEVGVNTPWTSGPWSETYWSS